MRPSRSRLAAIALFGAVVAACTSTSSPLPSSLASDVPSPPMASPTPVRPASPATAEPTATQRITTTPAPTDSAIAASWDAAGQTVTRHAYHTSILLPDGRVLVAGGLIDDRFDGQMSAAAEMFDPIDESWSATGAMTKARWGHSATLLPDGTVLVAGGYINSADPRATAELFHTATGRWTAIERMIHGRGGHTATLLPDGRVLVVGGGVDSTESEGGPRSATAELYDPKTGKWTATGTMTEARRGFTATLLPNGTVLVAGGDTGFSSAESYDPATGAWTATGNMVEGRFGHTATLLGDGTVLVAGGCACSEPGAVASAELYDPATGRWATTGNMDMARIFHTSTLLADGTVLVVDDGLSGETMEPSAELYDPDIGRWVLTASPAHDRRGYSATRLTDGRVLVVGDYTGDGGRSSEVYDPGA